MAINWNPETDDDRIAAALSRMGGGSAAGNGMISQSAIATMTPEERKIAEAAAAMSTDGRRSKLKAQMAFADSLRGTKTPQGRQVGDLFFASSPTESLGALAKQAAGIYAAGKAGEGYDEADVADSEAARNQRAVETDEKNIERKLAVEAQQAGFDNARGLQDDRQAFEGGENRTLAKARREESRRTRMQQQLEQNDKTLEEAQMREERLRERTREPFHNPKFGEKGEPEVLNYFDGGRVDVETGAPVFEDAKGNPVDVTGLTPYSAGAAGSAFKASPEGRKPEAKLLSEYTQATNLVNQLDDLTLQMEGFDENQMDMLNQPKAEIALDMVGLPEAARRGLEDQFVFSDPGVKEFRNRSAKWESDISKLLSGAALTGYEIEARDEWSPYATGLTNEAKKIRMDTLRRDLRDQRGNFEKLYPNYTLDLKNTGDSKLALDVDLDTLDEEQLKAWLLEQEKNG